MERPELTEDCASCADLCCVALAFDAGPAFAIDKPAGTPCPNLAECGGCTIHDRREARGFTGCMRYACHGAGQYVTQVMFGGQSWRDDPRLLAPMTEAFRDMALVQEMRSLLDQARRLDLPEDRRAELERLDAALTPVEPWRAADLVSFLEGALPGEVRSFLRSLAAYVPRGAMPR